MSVPCVQLNRRAGSNSTGSGAGEERWRAWRKHMGFVAQDDRLMSGTLARTYPDLLAARENRLLASEQA